MHNAIIRDYAEKGVRFRLQFAPCRGDFSVVRIPSDIFQWERRIIQSRMRSLSAMREGIALC